MTTWSAVIHTSVSAGADATAKVLAMTNGFNSAVHTTLDAFSAQRVHPKALRDLQVLIDDMISKSATLQSILGL